MEETKYDSIGHFTGSDCRCEMCIRDRCKSCQWTAKSVQSTADGKCMESGQTAEGTFPSVHAVWYRYIGWAKQSGRDRADPCDNNNAWQALSLIHISNQQTPFANIESEQRIVEICDSLSIGASVENMILTATSYGLGTLWIANTCFAYNDLIDFIGTEHQLTGIVAVGFANEKPAKRPRKPFKDIIEYR